MEKVGNQDQIRNTAQTPPQHGPQNKQGTGIQKVWNTVETTPQQEPDKRKEQVFNNKLGSQSKQK